MKATLFRIGLVVLLVASRGATCLAARAQPERRVSVALLDLGASETAARVSERLSKLFAGARGKTKFALLDRGLSRAAARGVGYAGSLNMTLTEARALGAAIGCDFYLTGDAQTLRRSSSARPVYFESYASLFVVSTRTGRLVLWDRPSAEADKPEESERALLADLETRTVTRYVAAIAEAAARDERERFETAASDAHEFFIDLSTDDGALSNADLREPAPYRRVRPEYPDAASRAEAEATVDALVEIGADGEVASVRVVRWAGFGLDDAVVSTVSRMHFRPAMRDGEPVAVRVLLRYNFRRPVQAKN